MSTKPTKASITNLPSTQLCIKFSYMSVRYINYCNCAYPYIHNHKIPVIATQIFAHKFLNSNFNFSWYSDGNSFGKVFWCVYLALIYCMSFIKDLQLMISWAVVQYPAVIGGIYWKKLSLIKCVDVWPWNVSAGSIEHNQPIFFIKFTLPFSFSVYGKRENDKTVWAHHWHKSHWVTWLVTTYIYWLTTYIIFPLLIPSLISVLYSCNLPVFFTCLRIINLQSQDN